MATNGATPAGLARALLDGAVRLRRGENVIIEAWSHCLPYATACVVQARRIGAHPILLLEDEAAYWQSIEEAPAVRRWSLPGAHELAALAKAHAYVFFPGPADRPRFRGLPPSVRADLVGYNDDWYKRARTGRVRGVRSMLGYASDAQAARWGVSAPEWRRALLRASVDVSLSGVAKAARSASAKLKKGSTLRITAPNGTDVRAKLRHRTPYVDDGSVSPEDLTAGRNVTVSPPGTVVVALDEKGTDGIAVANRPSFLSHGRTDGGEWEIGAGRLTQYRYTDGQREFEEAYRSAPKGRDVVAIFSIGLNTELGPGVPQVEDQEAGAVTLGIGGNQSYGGTNRCPFVSWIVLGEATVAVDGKPLCDRGQLL